MTRTPKKQPAKGTLWWVARDKYLDGYWYTISAERDKPYDCGDGRFSSADGLKLCAKLWHRAHGLHLKPGDAPVRIRIREGWWERV